MAPSLTRRQLYELVWAKPRTELAKQFGISDVALGKLCRQLNVPAPPPGYWAHLAGQGRGKKKFLRPPLTYTLAERITEDHDEFHRALPVVDSENFDVPLPPTPSIQEAVDDTVERYFQLAKKVVLPKPGRGTHAIVEKIMAEDDRLAALQKAYSWERPKYQSAAGKSLLAGLNRLLWWWNDLGFRPSSSGIRHIRLYVSVGSYSVSFEIAHTDAGGSSEGKRPPDRFEFRFDVDERYSRQQSKPMLIFATFDSDAIYAMTRLVIHRRESGYRSWLKRDYDHLVWERGQAIEEDRAAREAERQRIEAVRQALLAHRALAIDDALAGIAKAERLRALVHDVERRLTTGPVEAEFGRWREWALGQAKSLDIRCRSSEELSAWIRSFQLSSDDQTWRDANC